MSSEKLFIEINGRKVSAQQKVAKSDAKSKDKFKNSIFNSPDIRNITIDIIRKIESKGKS